MKKRIIILGIIALVLIGIIGGSSYAYFSSQNPMGSEEEITSGTMSLLLTDGQIVTANNLVPGQSIEKTFKVKNTGNVDTRYDVYLSEVVNTFVDKTDLVYELISNDGGYNTTSQVQVPNEETKIINQYLIAPTVEHTYTLRITFLNKQTTQNSNMGRTFTAKINVNEYSTNTSEKIIKLIDTNNNIVDKQIVGVSQTEYTLDLSNTSLTNTTNIYCNNGGVPTINGNTLNVTGITNDTECKISNDIVDTINNKLTTSKTGIVMTNNQSNVTIMDILANKEIVFDLNGKTIESTGVNETSNDYSQAKGCFRVSGSLIINDSKGNGGIFTGKTSPVIYLNNNAKLVVNGGTYEGRYSISSDNSNLDVTINNGVFKSKLYTVLNFNNNGNNCDITINGGTFQNELTQYNVYSKLVNSSFTINGGEFTSNGIVIGNESGTMDIYSGNFESLAECTVLNGENGIINIRGNQVIKDNNDNYVSGTYIHANVLKQMVRNSGTMNIYGGTLESSYSQATGCTAIWNIKGNVNIYGGSITADRDIAVYNVNTNSITKIYGGNISSRQHWGVAVQSGEVHVYGGNINGTYGITSTGGTLYVTSGNITGTNGSFYNWPYNSYTASKSYICGGTYTNAGNDIVVNDSTASIKYKSTVIWTGKSGPTVGGSQPSVVSLDDTITCPSN